jgi:hypothetical protein
LLVLSPTIWKSEFISGIVLKYEMYVLLVTTPTMSGLFLNDIKIFKQVFFEIYVSYCFTVIWLFILLPVKGLIPEKGCFLLPVKRLIPGKRHFLLRVKRLIPGKGYFLLRVSGLIPVVKQVSDNEGGKVLFNNPHPSKFSTIPLKPPQCINFTIH